jgi:hypothetical protein
LTAFIYLNADFQNGHTRFFRDVDFCDQEFKYEGHGIIDIIPSEGMLNVFQHDLWHMGLAMSGGRKYGVRVMILYRLGQESVEEARLTPVWTQ